MEQLWRCFYENNGDCTFTQAERFSPYLQRAGSYGNVLERASQEILVNGFYRYEEILAPLFQEPLLAERKRERDIVFDVLFHYLVWTDMHDGISRREILAKELFQMIQDGAYGKTVSVMFHQLTNEEKFAMCYFMLTQQEAGSSLFLCYKVVQHFFPNSAIYKRKDREKDILIYMGEERSRLREERMQGIEELFLPIGYRQRLFWKEHFGVFGAEDTMHIGHTEIF